jgi:hypothetical protein
MRNILICLLPCILILIKLTLEGMQFLGCHHQSVTATTHCEMLSTQKGTVDGISNQLGRNNQPTSSHAKGSDESFLVWHARVRIDARGLITTKYSHCPV